MPEKILEEINSLKNAFLVDLKDDEDNSLHIIICGASYQKTSDKDISELAENVQNEKLAELIRNCTGVTPDYSAVYDIFFENYFGYSVRNESYTIWDNDEEFEGKRFRIYSKSKYSDYLQKAAPVTQTMEFTHYGIVCENHIIDIASDRKPVITKIQQ